MLIIYWWLKENLFSRTCQVTNWQYAYIFFKKSELFCSTRPPASFFMAKLTRTKQLIDCGLTLFSLPFSGSAVFSPAQLFIQPAFAQTICTYGILICNLCLLVDFKFSFALYIIKFSLLQLVSLVKNLLIYLFSVLYNESLAKYNQLCSFLRPKKIVFKLFSFNVAYLLQRYSVPGIYDQYNNISSSIILC